MFGGTCGARQLTIVLACAFLVLGACNDGPQPIEPPPSASVTIAPPEMPEAAKANTEEGALAFVEYYIKLLNYGALTGNTAELKNFSEAPCNGCQHYIDLYERIYSAGGFIKGGEWVVADSTIVKKPKLFEVFVNVAAASSEFSQTQGSNISTSEAATYDISFEVRLLPSPTVRGIFLTKAGE